MIVIDREKCTGCGLCVKDCPADRLRIEEEKAVYTPGCIQCGHCVAICPSGAASIPEYDMDDVEDYDASTFGIEPERFLRAVKFRRSIRRFQDKKMEQAMLARILEAGRYTATAKNRQDCRMIVLQERLEEFKDLLWEQVPQMAEEIKETLPHYAMMFKFMYRRRRADKKDDPLFFNAPVCLIIATKNVLDGGLAAANIENMAVAEGAGVLYDGYLQRVIEGCPELKEWLGISEIPIACCMLMGHPAVTYRRTAPRKKANIDWR